MTSDPGPSSDDPLPDRAPDAPNPWAGAETHQPAGYQPPNTQPGSYQPPNTQPPNTQPGSNQPPNTQPANYPPPAAPVAPPGWSPTPGGPGPFAYPAAPPPRPPRARIERREVLQAVVLVAVLAVLGAILGYAWSAWAHAASHGAVVFSTSIGNIPDETEGFVAMDGRFAVLTGVLGLVAGVLTWLRRGTRGPVTALALGVGGTIGALLTALVGHLVSSGRTSAPVNQSFIDKLSLHAHGLIALEGGAALLVYLICALVIGSDALGREGEDGPAVPSAAPFVPGGSVG